MIYLVTGRPGCYDWDFLKTRDIVQGKLEDFLNWIRSGHKSLQLDVETNMVPDDANQYQDRKLLVVQLGTNDEKIQWEFEFHTLNKEWIDALKEILSNDEIAFIGHNMKFEYVAIQVALGVKIENIHDTYLMSRVLNTGLDLPRGFHSLAGCLERFFNITMDKAAQTTFTTEPLSIDQIEYAALDVVKCYALAKFLAKELKDRDLWYVYNYVEREVLKVYGDMELTPMGFDIPYWKKLSQEFIDEKEQVLLELDAEVLKDKKLIHHLKTSNMVLKDSLIQPIDELKLKWSSTTHKKLVFSKIFPFISDDVKTKPQLKKWIKENQEDIPLDKEQLLADYMARNYDNLNAYMIKNHMDWLQEVGLFIKEGTVQIKWTSNTHKLYIFNHYYPKLESTNAGALGKITANPLIKVFKKFNSAAKRVSTYGESFLSKYVRRDGMIAPMNPNQILKLGTLCREV